MTTLKSFIAANLAREQDLDAFGMWAFGKDILDMKNGMDFMNAWNDLHGDVLMLDAYGIMNDDLQKMLDLWNNRC